jgi:hypothetical protein
MRHHEWKCESVHVFEALRVRVLVLYSEERVTLVGVGKCLCQLVCFVRRWHCQQTIKQLENPE